MVQTLEATAFAIQKYYDNLQFYTTSEKLKKCSSGLRWNTLTKNRPIKIQRFSVQPKSKRMVPYSFFGIRAGIPSSASNRQYFAAADTTDITHVYAHLTARYNEWHQDFNFSRA